MAENGWQEWGRFVLKELERLSDSIEKLESTTTESYAKMMAEIATLKVKSGLWGAAAGAVPVIIAIAVYLIKKQL